MLDGKCAEKKGIENFNSPKQMNFHILFKCYVSNAVEEIGTYNSSIGPAAGNEQLQRIEFRSEKLGQCA